MTYIYFEKLHSNICDVAKPPSPSKTNKPDWWNNMSRYIMNKNSSVYPKDIKHRNFATIRNCPGIEDVFNFGYTVYFPTDIFIDSTDKENIYWFAPNIEIPSLKKTGLKYIDFNNIESTENFLFPENSHKISLKINSLWGIKTENGYSIWISRPMFRSDLPLIPIDSIVDSDKFPLRAPVSFFVKNNFKGLIKAGTPMYQVIPFKRENFKSKIIDVDIKDAEKFVDIIDSVFTNPYKKFFWTRKKFN